MNVKTENFAIAFNALKGTAERLGVDLTVKANLEFLTETAVVTAQAHEMLRAAETLEQNSRHVAGSRLASLMIKYG